MARLLIGSSNVAGTYTPERFKEYAPYKMIKCTKMELFRVVVDDIKEEKEVIISVIENFLCDAIRSNQAPSPEQIDSVLEEVIIDYMNVIKRVAVKLPGTKFALAQPILRPFHNWYMERYDGFCKIFVTGINAMGLANVSKLDTLTRMSQNFVADGVHLTPESSRTFVNMLLYNAEALFVAEIINLEEEGSGGAEGDRGQLDFEKTCVS